MAVAEPACSKGQGGACGAASPAPRAGLCRGRPAWRARADSTRFVLANQLSDGSARGAAAWSFMRALRLRDREGHAFPGQVRPHGCL